VSSQLVFFDANVLFSAALGGPAFALLLELERLGSIRLVTSRMCLLEARENLVRKRPDAVAALETILSQIDVGVAPIEGFLEWAAELVHIDDAQVLAAARAFDADHLVTGDTIHFGSLMGRRDLGILVWTPRSLLLERHRDK